MSSGKGSKDRMEEAMQRANKLAQERLDWNKAQMDKYENMYGDVESQIIADAESGEQGDYQGAADRAAADTAQQFDTARAERQRQMASMGLDPSGGRYRAGERDINISEAAATAANVNQARNREEQQTQQEHMQDRQMAMNLGTNRFNQAFGGINSSYQGAQNQASQNAQQWQQQSQAEASSMGNMIGMAAGAGLTAATGNPMFMASGMGMGGKSKGGGGGGKGLKNPAGPSMKTDWGTSLLGNSSSYNSWGSK